MLKCRLFIERIWLHRSAITSHRHFDRSYIDELEIATICALPAFYRTPITVENDRFRIGTCFFITLNERLISVDDAVQKQWFALYCVEPVRARATLSCAPYLFMFLTWLGAQAHLAIERCHCFFMENSDILQNYEITNSATLHLNVDLVNAADIRIG